jgi:hypothetical protein
MITSGDMANGMFAPLAATFRRSMTPAEQRAALAEAMRFVDDGAGSDVAFGKLRALLGCGEDCNHASAEFASTLADTPEAERLVLALRAFGSAARGNAPDTDGAIRAVVEAAQAYDAYVMSMDAAALRTPPAEIRVARTLLIRAMSRPAAKRAR